MAKPGSRQARALANGQVPDLGLRALSDERAAELQEMVELKTGRRCAGCGRRIGLGFHFTSIDVRNERQPVVRLAACTRDDCDFAGKARDGAIVAEQVEYGWLDPAGLNARAMDMSKLGVQFIETPD